jgi:hypothetical protein
MHYILLPIPFCPDGLDDAGRPVKIICLSSSISIHTPLPILEAPDLAAAIALLHPIT